MQPATKLQPEVSPVAAPATPATPLSPALASPPNEGSWLTHRDGALAGPLRKARRLIVLVFGATLLAAGALMLVLPGPGLLGIAAGLSVLGSEFAWARRLLRRVRESARTALQTAASPSAPAEGGGDRDETGVARPLAGSAAPSPPPGTTELPPARGPVPQVPEQRR